MTDRQFTFPAVEKLKSRKLIQQLFAQGKTVHVPLLTCHFLLNPSSLPVRLQAGVGASARQFKKATDRNRIKRLLREAYRLNKHSLQETLIQQKSSLAIFLLYNGKEVPTFGNIENAMQQLLPLLQRKIAVVKEN